MNSKLRKIIEFFRDERGSLSLLIVSLLIASLFVVMVLTNVSSVYLAKRALTQATESAAQRGVRNLNAAAYYTRQYIPEKNDPGIPIDCEKGRTDVVMSIYDWIQLSNEQKIAIGRPNLTSIHVDEFFCDGYEISVSTSARIRLPFVVSIFQLEDIEIRSQVSTIAERKITSTF